MFRRIVQNLPNIGNSSKFLYPYKTICPILKRFKFTKTLENANKAENSKLEELKRYRRAEVTNQSC